MSTRQKIVLSADLVIALYLTLMIGNIGVETGAFHSLTLIAAIVCCTIGLLAVKSKLRWIFINAAAMAIVALIGQWGDRLFENSTVSILLHAGMLYYGLLAFSFPFVKRFSQIDNQDRQEETDNNKKQ